MAIRTGACGKKMIGGELILKIDSGKGNFPLINDKDLFAFKIFKQKRLNCIGIIC